MIVDLSDKEALTIKWFLGSWYPDTKEDYETKNSILEKLK